MIEELQDLIAAFPGEAGRTRCFTHIINLIAKSVIKQFDIPKKAGDEPDDALTELIVLAGDIEDEEQVTRDGVNEDDELDDNNDDGWINEEVGMSEEDWEKLNKDVQPVRLVLVKVSVLITVGIDM
jgi:hypothetical protein